MTPELQNLIQTNTCPHCLGNGRFGGRRLINGSYVDEGYRCEPCSGTGVRSEER